MSAFTAKTSFTRKELNTSIASHLPCPDTPARPSIHHITGEELLQEFPLFCTWNQERRWNLNYAGKKTEFMSQSVYREPSNKIKKEQKRTFLLSKIQISIELLMHTNV